MIKNLIISILIIMVLISNNLLICSHYLDWISVLTFGLGLLNYALYSLENAAINKWNNYIRRIKK